RFASALAERLGIVYEGDAPATPDFLVVEEALGAPFTDYRQVNYERGSAVRAEGADVLARVGLPYFSRSPEQFYGHRQAPFDRVSDLPAIVQRGRIIYAHAPLFGAYRKHAVPAYRDLVGRLLERLVPDPLVQTEHLPTTAELALLRQSGEGRTILHLIHAVPQRRGPAIDIVEDVLPLTDVRVGVRLNPSPTMATLAPSGDSLPIEVVDGVAWVTVPRVEEHQIVAFA
ncbi:MAG TPA: hypothetical protein VFQ80_19870, partial [Thermomicrobiales bacterium]|nr:hypothetical protein [Thermomicrobiales bacterium]